MARVCRCVDATIQAMAPVGSRWEFGTFVQVIQGHVSDASRVRAQLDKWVAEVAPQRWVGWAAPRD